MADPRAPQRAVRTNLITLPRPINVDQGKARAWGSLADTTFRMSVRVDDRLDTEAAVESARDGMSGDITHGLMFSPTVRGRAYTQQAEKSYWNNLEATARLRMDELAAANRQNPQGMQEAVDQYIETTTGSLPDEFKQRARNYLTATSRSHIASARAALVKQRIAVAEAQGLLAERTATLEIDRLSGGLFSPDAESAAAAAVGLDAVRARLAALYSSTITDDLGNKVPVFSPEQQAKAGVMLEERVAKGALTGWYNEQSNKLGALRAINAGQVRAPLVRDGEVVGTYNPIASLGSEDRDRLISKLRGAYSTELSIQRSQQAMHDRAVKKRQDAMLVDLIRTGANDPTAPVRGMALQMLDDVTDPAVARQLHAMVSTGSVSGNVVDSVLFNAAKIDALQGEFDWRSERYQGLPLQARVQLIEVNLSAQERLTSSRMFDDGDFRDVRDLIAGQFASIDFQALQAQVGLGRKTPKIDTALGHVAALMYAKFTAAIAGESFDAKRWYIDNVKEVADTRAGTIEQLRTDVKAADSQFNKYDREQMRGLNPADKQKDPEYLRLRDAWLDSRRRLREATQ